MKVFLKIACFFGATAVILGAFGAHGLKNVLSESALKSFQTGVQYQMYHTFALLAVGILQQILPHNSLKWSGYGFMLGIVLFSGSIYGLTILHWQWLGPVTPIGGICFVIGWASMGYALFQKPTHPKNRNKRFYLGSV